jgi:hypothetical protein
MIAPVRFRHAARHLSESLEFGSQRLVVPSQEELDELAEWAAVPSAVHRRGQKLVVILLD